MVITMFKKFFKNNKPAMGSVDYIVVGLGNPGSKYENTRHNAGFLAVDAMGEKFGFKVDKLRFKSLCGQTVIGGKKVLFMKPTTFMNLSGEAVRAAMEYYKVSLSNVIVIYDDISLEPGKLRIRRKGSHGGHNGIKSIIYITGYDEFPRIKLGVGAKPHPEYDLADWVLSKFTKKETEDLSIALKNCGEIVSLISEGNMDEAMNKYNS